MRVVKVKAGDVMRYYPLSDVHWPEHEHDHLVEWLELVKEDDKALVTLGGDLFDFARTHARNHFRSYTSDLNSYKPVDRVCLSEVEEFAKFLEPIKDKIHGVVAGNHHHRFPDGQISDQKVALLLKRPWMGPQGIVNVYMRQSPKGKTTPIRILIHHDAGSSARTPGADFNTFHKAASNYHIDIIALGHTHRLYAVPGVTKLGVNEEGHIGSEQTVFIRSGAYLKRCHEPGQGYDEAPYEPDYGEEKAYPPATLGHSFVQVSLKNHKPQYRLVTDIY